MSTDPESRDNYGPYLPNVGSRCPATKKIIPFNDVEAVRSVFEAHGAKMAGFLVEPIQGEAGIVVPDGALGQGVKLLGDDLEKVAVGQAIVRDEAAVGLFHHGDELRPGDERRDDQHDGKQDAHHDVVRVVFQSRD